MARRPNPRPDPNPHQEWHGAPTLDLALNPQQEWHGAPTLDLTPNPHQEWHGAAKSGQLACLARLLVAEPWLLQALNPTPTPTPTPTHPDPPADPVGEGRRAAAGQHRAALGRGARAGSRRGMATAAAGRAGGRAQPRRRIPAALGRGARARLGARPAVAGGIDRLIDR